MYMQNTYAIYEFNLIYERIVSPLNYVSKKRKKEKMYAKRMKG